MKVTLFIIALIASLGTSLYFIIKRKLRPDVIPENISAPKEDAHAVKDTLGKIDEETKNEIGKINDYDTSTHDGGTALLRDYEEALGGTAKSAPDSKQSTGNASDS